MCGHPEMSDTDVSIFKYPVSKFEVSGAFKLCCEINALIIRCLLTFLKEFNI